MNPFPIILSAPSGGGKTTIARVSARVAVRTLATRCRARRGAPRPASETGATTTF